MATPVTVSLSPSGSVSLASRVAAEIDTEAPDFTVAESLTTTGASFTAVTVRLIVATLLSILPSLALKLKLSEPL